MQTLSTAPSTIQQTWPGNRPDTAGGPREDLGIASLAQLLAAGFSRAQVAALERRRAIVRIHDGVYRTSSTVLSPRRRLLAACLALGGVVAASDRSALWLWDLWDCEPPVEVATAALDRRVPSGVAVHVRADLRPEQVSVHRGVPVTSPARTLADVGAVVDRKRLAVAVDKALYLRLVTLQQLRGLVGVAAGGAHPGVKALGAVLDHRVHGF